MSETEYVPVDELRELVNRWTNTADAFEDGGSGYNAGISEGAQSAALELDRVIDRHGEERSAKGDEPEGDR